MGISGKCDNRKEVKGPRKNLPLENTIVPRTGDRGGPLGTPEKKMKKKKSMGKKENC